MYMVRTCPVCGGNTNIITAHTRDGAVYRIRSCSNVKCKNNFETVEVPSGYMADVTEMKAYTHELEKEILKLKIKLQRIQQCVEKEAVLD